MEFKPNQQGLDALFRDIAAKIERVDRDLRAEWIGKPADEIEPAAARALSQAGVNLAGVDLRAYAESIERGENFEITLS